MNAIASKPAVTNAILIPLIPFGMFTKLNCSRIPANTISAKATEEKVRADFLEKELQQLREENKALRERYEKAHKELVRVQIEQKTLGKIKVNTDL